MTESAGSQNPPQTVRESFSLPIVSGVYMLFKAQRLVYVGRSSNAYHRIASHRSKGREFDYALVTPCPDADSAWVESAMIAAMQPDQNRSGKGSAGRSLVIREVGPAPLDPLMAMPVGTAVQYAKQYGLAGAVRDAVRSGDLKSFPKDPRRTSRGAIRLVTVGDLQEWCGARQKLRIVAA